MRASRIPLALALVTLFLLAIPASTAGSGDVYATQQSTSEQPDSENNTFYLWGRETGEPCWGHFAAEDGDSAPDGYAEKEQSSGKMVIEWTCRMDPPLADNFALEEGKEVSVHLMIELNGDWENGQGNCNGDCENLNVTLMKGGVETAKQEVAALSSGENEVMVSFPVDENLTVWDKNTDNPGIRVRMVLYPEQGLECFVFYCDALFRMYYSGQDEQQFNGSAEFPILNQSAAEEILDPEGNESSTPDEGFLSGFGTVVAVSGIGLAALSRRKRE